MPQNYKNITKASLLSLFLFTGVAFAQSPLQKSPEKPLMIEPNHPEFKIDIPKSILGDIEGNKPNQSPQESPEPPKESPPPIKKVEPATKDASADNLLSFSQNSISEDSKVTQLKIRNIDDLKKAGIKQEEIYRMVNEFDSFAKNFYFKYNPSDGKVIFLVTLAPTLENGRAVALEKGIKIESDYDLKKFCSKEPTHCSVTSMSAIQNGNMPSMPQFEEGVYKNSNEIYWKNFDFDGKIDFFFEISLKNT